MALVKLAKPKMESFLPKIFKTRRKIVFVLQKKTYKIFILMERQNWNQKEMQEGVSTNEETETYSSSEEEIEPKFKYIRIANDLLQILNKEVVVCSQVNSKVS